jgi:hypothetical protein
MHGLCYISEVEFDRANCSFSHNQLPLVEFFESRLLCSFKRLIARCEDKSYEQKVYDDYEPWSLIQKVYGFVDVHGLSLSNNEGHGALYRRHRETAVNTERPAVMVNFSQQRESKY